jgi:hypothetical protein
MRICIGRSKEIIDTFIFYALIFTIIVAFYSHIEQGDLNAHVRFAMRIANDPSLLVHFFEPGFHLLLIGITKLLHTTYHNTAPYLLAGFYLINVYITSRILYLELQLSESLTRFLVLLLLVPAAVYLPWFSRSFYLGIGTPNVWHSPTQVMVLPFAMLITYYSIKLLHKSREKKYKSGFLLSSLLFVSSIMKPAFAEMFLPSIGIYFLVRRKVRTFENALFLAIVLLPTLIILPVQYLMMSSDKYLMLTGGDQIILSWFRVIKFYYKANPLFAFLQALLFPILVLMVLRNKTSNYTKYCWLFVILSYLQAAFIAQERLLTVGDFGWPYLIGLHLIFVFSIIDYVRWIKLEDSNVYNKKAMFLGFALCLHVLSGLAYFYGLLTGVVII